VETFRKAHNRHREGGDLKKITFTFSEVSQVTVKVDPFKVILFSAAKREVPVYPNESKTAERGRPAHNFLASEIKTRQHIHIREWGKKGSTERRSPTL